MGKSRTDRNGFTREQRLVKENQGLKRQLQALRKSLARLDLDRYSQVRDIIEEHYSKDRKDEGQEILDKMKEDWKCRECEAGYLEITLFSKINDTYYYRRCNLCTHRTKSQKYTSQVSGIIKKVDEK